MYSAQELDYEIKVRESADNLLKFTEITMPDYRNQEDMLATAYEAGLHHKAIAEALEQVDSGRIMRLIITMPPRHGKSELCSRRMPCWFMGRDRSRQVIFATYSSDFAQDFGRKWRDIMTSDLYKRIFPGVEPKTETRSAVRMELKDGGLMIAAGVGGPVTGRGADLLLIDDPFKNREEAESLTIRNKRWDWFTSTAYTRLMPGGRVIVIATRWHEDDMIGRLLSTEYMTAEQISKWTLLDLPAIAHENTPNERALWPSKYPLDVLKETREVLGPRDWNALYQQKPTPPEGAFFKRNMIEPYLYSNDELPSHLTHYTSFDLAVSKEKKRDATCCGTGGLDENDVLWLLPEIFWQKTAADQAVEYIAQHIMAYDPLVVYCEKGQLDKAVGPFLEKYLNEHKIYKFFERLPTVGKNKGARATAIRGRMQQGKVRFPKDAAWWPAAFDQLLKFTGSGDDKEDDFVDMLAQLGQGLHRQYHASQVELPDNTGPQIGTLGWVKADSRYRDRLGRQQRGLEGW